MKTASQIIRTLLSVLLNVLQTSFNLAVAQFPNETQNAVKARGLECSQVLHPEPPDLLPCRERDRTGRGDQLAGIWTENKVCDRRSVRPAVCLFLLQELLCVARNGTLRSRPLATGKDLRQSRTDPKENDFTPQPSAHRSSVS